MLSELALRHCHAAKRIYIGYSGGVDSHVLLALCAATDTLTPKITAVYVHHGLQAVATAWADHCAAIAAELGVAFLLLRVNAAAQSGESPEEAARNARYNALKPLIADDDVLLIAQHREDQLETVLLQLFRGSGLAGLSGMPERMAFGQGVLLRPLLNVEKVALNAYAQRHQLHWIEDPSNQTTDYDRNFLRNTIVPLLKQRWSALDKTVARSAQHCAVAQRIVTDSADTLFLSVFNAVDNTLCLVKLTAYLPAQQQLIIRHWLQFLGLRMPSQAFVERTIIEVIAARDGSNPLLSTQGYQIRRYRQRLYAVKALTQDTEKTVNWLPAQTILPLSDNQQLVCLPASAGILRTQWQQAQITVKFRHGGETIRLPERQGHHALKKLFQEAAIPPWQRPFMPLVYLNDTLAAVGEHWISADFYQKKAQSCFTLALQNR